MSTTLKLLLLLAGLFSAYSDGMAVPRDKRGTRSFRNQCVDAQGVVRSVGQVWMRWRGQQAESCRCTSRGLQFCHYVPVISCTVSRCYNGGTCKEAVYSSDFLCQCPSGFMGTQCEINTNDKCVTGPGSSYRGTWGISRSGAECINWNATSLRGKKFTATRPDASSLGLGNHNYCRNPDGDSKPWCYVYKGTQIVWEFCTLPTCAAGPNSECVEGKGGSYRGTKAVTKSGGRCLPWDSPTLSRKKYTAWRPDARELGLGSHNFCRNPDGDLTPWCHTYRGSQLTWEFCEIPRCGKRPPTTLGPRAPTTGNNNRGTCGLRAAADPASEAPPSFRMHGGKDSDIKEQPWQAAITVYRPRSKSHTFLCGGVLIDSCWLLSAAHCFQENFTAGRLQVVLGRTFRLQNSSSEQIFEVEKYWVHEHYDEQTYDNDIVLLKLKGEDGICAIHSPEVMPACLPDASLQLPDWTECEISGYGKEHEFSPFYSERVKRGHVRLWPQDRCVPEKLSGRPVTPNMLCAGDTRGLDDACKGDSGGPLVCPSGDRMTLLGLISWGDGCGKQDTPGVYTRVTQYVHWVTSKMRTN
ncbi:tissue-type plasminogen activator isoform X2 [Denticeps clupeoides]|uniref:tissue-type plasminogen activator isoform X2 n=1 Tax=Denticeps clupeoides TaxID=299321 RepID=UPI0010A33B01|nr:tissue-type plasminogen activator isoform X2 [Denticeps clupeoides]